MSYASLTGMQVAKNLCLPCGLRTPTYTTAGGLGGGGGGGTEGLSDSGAGHASAVVSLTVIPTDDAGDAEAALGGVVPSSLTESNSFQVTRSISATGSLGQESTATE